MPISKRTVVETVEVTASGVIMVRLSKQRLDGATVTSLGWHRAGFAPGTSVEAQIATINADLVKMEAGAIDDSQWEQLRSIVASLWTDQLIAAFAESQSVGGTP